MAVFPFVGFTQNSCLFAASSDHVLTSAVLSLTATSTREGEIQLERENLVSSRLAE